MNKVEKITINTLDIYTPRYDRSTESIKKEQNFDFEIDNYPFFPLLLDENGRQWEYANRYLLHKLKDYKLPSPKTLDSIASDLRDFKIFCNEESLDYLSIPRPISSPIRKYRRHLEYKIFEYNISPNTVKRKISSVVAFYDWLIKNENIKFEFPLWKTRESYITYTNDYGKNLYKKIETKDITKISTTKNKDLYDNYIMDGGKLYPLEKDQQNILFSTLNKCNNIEMFLGFSIALATGARMQTTFTLRLSHFKREITDEEKLVRIPIGYGTHCDTKYSKNNILYFPPWLYKRIQRYINSNRYQKRKNKSKHIFQDDSLQYLFLTNRGTPFYCSKFDKYRTDYKSPPSGETVRVFIANTLLPKLKEIDKNFVFSFHDLRATFGINLVDSYTEMLKDNEISISQILHIVKDRLGHTSLKTTELYLNFRKRHKIAIQAQNNYENFLRELLNE